MIDPRIYLASRSPRRRELLTQVGVRFDLLLFRLPPQVVIASRAAEKSRCYRHAVAELVRLLGRLGTTAELKPGGSLTGDLSLALSVPAGKPPAAGRLPTDLPADGSAPALPAPAAAIQNVPTVTRAVAAAAHRV